MAAAPAYAIQADQLTAVTAGFPGTSVHQTLAAIIAIQPGDIAKVAEGGSACMDADLKHLQQCFPQPLETGSIQLVGGSLRADPGSKQALIGIDVPHASHQGLVK